MPATTSRKQWISGAQARRISGLTWAALLKLGVTGQVRTQALPGVPMKFHVEDVERIGRDMVEEGR